MKTKKDNEKAKKAYREAAKFDLLSLPRPTIVCDEVRVRLPELGVAKGREELTMPIVKRGKWGIKRNERCVHVG